MGFSPRVQASARTKRENETFLGYDHRARCTDGAWYDMENITAAQSPLGASRPKRGVGSTCTGFRGMCGGSPLCRVEGTSLLCGETDMTGYLTAAGVQLTGGTGEKQLVRMGAYLCIFPDKIYLNTADYSDCGSMDAQWTAGTGVTVTLKLADGDGNPLTPDYTQSGTPEDPESGDVWLDTGVSPHCVRSYSGSLLQWTEETGVTVRLEAAGIGSAFAVGDGIELTGITASTQASELCGWKVIRAVGTNYVAVTGILDGTVTQTAGISLKREAPEMDYVVQAENRLWGCRYGITGGEPVNELYCCKLGDFKNWRVYDGISTDAWAATLGSDGAFTGAASFLGSPVFFKETCMHTITVAPDGGHGVSEVQCRGVEQGSGKSVATVGETLLYKSRDGICAYDGSLPVLISQKLGEARYRNAAAGSVGERYYISMQDDADAWQLLCYDKGKRLWTREDSLRVSAFAQTDGSLWAYCPEDGKLRDLTGQAGTAEGTVQWMLESGIQGWSLGGGKYLASVEAWMQLETGTAISAWIQYDSDGRWVQQAVLPAPGAGVVKIPLRPRRCDHFAFRLQGTGDMTLFRIRQILDRGDDM